MNHMLQKENNGGKFLPILLAVELAGLVLCAPVVRRVPMSLYHRFTGYTWADAESGYFGALLVMLFTMLVPVFIGTLCVFLNRKGAINLENIKQNIALFVDDISHSRLRVFALLFFGAFITLYAWQCDDAYHSHVMSRNLAEGNGLVYNVGERVSASTCPLWTIVVAGAYKVFGEVYFTSTFLNIFLSCAALYILLRTLCRKNWHIIGVTAVLLMSRSFVSYTTSGLENSLLFFLFAVLLKIFFENNVFSFKKILAMTFISSLILITRQDNLLILAPVMLYAIINTYFVHSQSFAPAGGGGGGVKIWLFLVELP